MSMELFVKKLKKRSVCFLFGCREISSLMLLKKVLRKNIQLSFPLVLLSEKGLKVNSRIDIAVFIYNI